MKHFPGHWLGMKHFQGFRMAYEMGNETFAPGCRMGYEINPRLLDGASSIYRVAEWGMKHVRVARWGMLHFPGCRMGYETCLALLDGVWNLFQVTVWVMKHFSGCRMGYEIFLGKRIGYQMGYETFALISEKWLFLSWVKKICNNNWGWLQILRILLYCYYHGFDCARSEFCT